MSDETREFLDSLPELEEGKTYNFRCYPGISCFNACCTDLNLTLTPYDVLRLRKALGKGSIDFLSMHTIGHFDPDTNMPLFDLRMSDNETRSCPFVTEQGCSVYADRPGACRMYPLGRATCPDGEGGVCERFFIVTEDHCKGFLEENEWTGESWKQDQGFEDYTASNDRYMQLLSRIKGTDRPLSEKMSHLAVLAMYKVDEFQRFITQLNIFDRVEVDGEQQKAILEDEFKALEFAMDWFEMMLFKDDANLKIKGA